MEKTEKYQQHLNISGDGRTVLLQQVSAVKRMIAALMFHNGCETNIQ